MSTVSALPAPSLPTGVPDRLVSTAAGAEVPLSLLRGNDGGY